MKRIVGGDHRETSVVLQPPAATARHARDVRSKTIIRPDSRFKLELYFMDVFIRGAQRVLALLDSARHKRASRDCVRIRVSPRLQSGSSNNSAWDRHRPGNFRSAREGP